MDKVKFNWLIKSTTYMYTKQTTTRIYLHYLKCLAQLLITLFSCSVLYRIHQRLPSAWELYALDCSDHKQVSYTLNIQSCCHNPDAFVMTHIFYTGLLPSIVNLNRTSFACVDIYSTSDGHYDKNIRWS